MKKDSVVVLDDEIVNKYMFTCTCNPFV